MLLDLLEKEQDDRGLTDLQFAELLGVPRTTWANARLKIRPLNNRVVRGAMKAFPHLTPQAVSFLLTDSTKGNRRTTKARETATTQPERTLEAASA